MSQRTMVDSTAECADDTWRVMIASSASPRHPTCGEVKRSYARQRCCDDEERDFLLSDL